MKMWKFWAMLSCMPVVAGLYVLKDAPLLVSLFGALVLVQLALAMVVVELVKEDSKD